jgi:hypothetical protein
LRKTVTESPREKIGLGWIIAIVALLALLAAGIMFYLQMSAPLREQPRHAFRPELGIRAMERIVRSIT